ncbi:hypothetical protein CROQUDRAFT_132535 [Cronartium quercuum f. sp. fusiforme G11]|uniref:Uncharacterized protein n=1 Tax=Cronartium quercuum f. sp. fusiforme G11 TaxID=708437 RepID=A0A9P6NNX5_9BASI|nr:hypothetical protein CROQUDRAFT_132535 [Cronartium quercuum f. sp. fusiforme G11]
MRELSTTGVIGWHLPKDIEVIFNVQHNCHDAQCPVKVTHKKPVEHQITMIHGPEVAHKSLNSFILNSAALHLPDVLQHWASLPNIPVVPGDWNDTVTQGLSNWKSCLSKQAEDKQK